MTRCSLRLLSALVLAGFPAALFGSATTTTLAITSGGSAVTTVTSGSVVTLTATVQAGITPVTVGQVNFCDATAKYCTDIHILGTAQLTKAGTALLKFRPGVGNHSYKAVFAGTPNGANNYAASASGTVTLVVTGLTPTGSTIAVSGPAGNYTLTATVGGIGRESPTGGVSLLDATLGNSVLGTLPLGQGTAGVQLFNVWSGVVPGSIGNGVIAVGDFNGDGIPDLAVANQDPGETFVNGSVSILLGNGDGTLTPVSANPATGKNPEFIAVGDFNSDGIPDLAVANSVSNTVTILLGNGDGTFTPASPSPLTGRDPASIAVGDFNGDGVPDLAVTNLGDDTVSILLGNGDGTFTAVSATPSTGYLPISIAVGDFNGDGIPDVAVVNQNADTVTILLGNGDGTFTALTVNPATGRQPNAIAVGDFNGDGIPDLAVLNAESNTVTIQLGNGDGTFTALSVSPAAPANVESIAVGDFNGDGIPDLAMANSILLGNGDGTFTAASTVVDGSWSVSSAFVAVGDFNGDGIPDFAAYYSDSVTIQQVELWSATATATGFAVPVATSTNQVVASYPGDTNNKPSVSSAISLPATKGTPTVSVTPSANPGPNGASETLTALVTGSGLTPTGTVEFADGIKVLGTGTLSNGLATYATSTLTVGSHSITVVYEGDSNYVAGTSPILNLTVENTIPPNPAPVISGLSPAFTSAGGVAFTLTITGTGFVSGSTVYWGPTALSTQFVSGTQLTAQVTVGDIATAGITAITVETPTPGGGTSNSLQFEADSAASGSTATFTTVTASVTPGSTANYAVTLPSTATSVTVTCLNLPAGASCTYSSTTGTLSIATSASTPAGTYQVTAVFTETLPGAATALVILPFFLLPLAGASRKQRAKRIWLVSGLGLVLMVVAAGAGCGGGSSSTPLPVTHQATTSGVVTLTIQ